MSDDEKPVKIYCRPPIEMYVYRGKAVVTLENIRLAFNRTRASMNKLMIDLLVGTSDSFEVNNIFPYKDPSLSPRYQDSYLLTKDAFLLLAIKIIGKEVYSLKEGYIHRFNTIDNAIMRKHYAEKAKLKDPY